MKSIRVVLIILFVGSLAICLITCGGGSSLSTISVTPSTANIPAGVTQQFTATGTNSDGTSHDITTQVSWGSSNTSVATVNGSGLATTVAPGTATIAAASGSILGSATLTVNSATLISISVIPTTPSLTLGATQQFTATGTYSDGTTHIITTQVIWRSSNTSVATIDSSGLATAVAVGAAIVSAASGSILGSTTLTVTSGILSSISVTPANLTIPSIPSGITQQFTATGTYSDGTSHDITTQVTWRSSNTAVAIVNNSGLGTAVAAGVAIISAASGSILGSTTLTVTPATLSSISITPANPSIPTIPSGFIQQFTATGNYSDGTSHNITTQVTWSSSNTSVAIVNSAGLATAVAAGNATITASSGIISGSTTLTATSATLSSISVTPANPSIPAGAIQQFTATGNYSDGTSYNITTQVTWSSSNTSVATVNSTGLATAFSAGTATITATSGSILGSTTLTVTPN